MTIAEHDLVVLTRHLPEHRLRAGDVGAVVHVYSQDAAYEVEFVTGGGQTLPVWTLRMSDLLVPPKSCIAEVLLPPDKRRGEARDASFVSLR
jgi:hypothetical protein